MSEGESSYFIHLNVELQKSEITVDETGQVVIANATIARAVDKALKDAVSAADEGDINVNLVCGCKVDIDIPCGNATCSVPIASCSV